ncbi:MAG TPA: glycosyltransferase family 2 protein [Candidatus Thermoplasmatota archaeon]|nr:glycosyltransferase family 2 protein [Candidatus Thermoplasmatota archaeon]
MRAEATAPPRRVTIVLPAKNEEHAIGRTLRALPLATMGAIGLEAEVVVLDGHSRDHTADIARAWGAKVVPDQEPGKGSALRNAIGQFENPFIVMLDADGTYAPDAIPRLLNPLLRGEADVALGHRRRLPGSMTSSHFLGNKALSVFSTILFGSICRDVCTGMWGFRLDALRSLPLRSNGFGLEVELFALATRLRMRIAHVRVDYLPRHGGPAKLSFGHDGLRIVRRLMRSRFGPLGTPNHGRPDPAATQTLATPEVRG